MAYITNDSTLPLSEKAIELQAEAVLECCDNEGHKDDAVKYTYDIVEDESGSAVLSGNKLTVTAGGRLVIRVTAEVNGLTRQSLKAFEVK